MICQGDGSLSEGEVGWEFEYYSNIPFVVLEAGGKKDTIFFLPWEKNYTNPKRMH